MNQYILFAIIGLGFGSIYAAVAMGVVVTYRGTGIINFATGAMAMWGAYVYDQLERTGEMVFPTAVIPHKIKLGDDIPFALSFVLAVLSCALVGLLVHALVFRPLRRAPILAKVVASVGVLLLIQALVVMQFQSTPRVVPSILPNEAMKVGSISFQRDRLWITLIVVLVALAVWAYFRFTRLGLATRASAENERAIVLARYSPQLLAGSTWILSSTVVGAIIILTAPLVILNPLLYPLAIVPALAAALIGRLQSIGITVTAALALGSFQAIVTFQTTKSWWPSWAITGLGDALPFVVIVVALFAFGDALPSRGALESDPLPAVLRPRMNMRIFLPLVAVGAALMVVTSGSYRFGLITSMIVAIIMLSLMILTGLVGQISLAQAGIAGTAGFALSKLANGASIPFPISTLVAALVATALGVLVGIPALRIRGAQLAVVTLAGAVALEKFIFRNPSFTDISGNPIPDAMLFGLDLGVREGRTIARLSFGILVLIVLALCTVLVANIAKSATGRRFLAVRSNERAGASVGISIAHTKLQAFAIASFLAGLGGAFIGYSRGQLSANSFATLVGLTFLAFAYLGGITSVSGAIIAATFAPLGIGFVIFDRNIELGSSYQIFAGIGLIVTAIFNPVGIAGANSRNWQLLKAWFARRHAVSVGVLAVTWFVRAVMAWFARSHTASSGAASSGAASVGAVSSGAASSGADPIGVRTGFFADSTSQAHAAIRPDFSKAEVVLKASNVVVNYGGLRAVDDFSMEIRKGQIVGLIGPNGAGKTTTIDAFTGFIHSRGRVEFRDQDLSALPPHERTRAGLARTWQSLELFTDLTVKENLQVASERASFKSVALDFVSPSRQTDLTQVDWALEMVGLSQYANAQPSSLSLGHQKLLGVARALASSPAVILLDEPAAGLDIAESQALGLELFDIVAHDISILLVDHDMGLVLDVCDYIYVLDFGKLIAQGTPAQIRVNDAVVNAYLGTAASR